MVLTNSPALVSLEASCKQDHQHVHLTGGCRLVGSDGRIKWVRRTAAAGAYPPALCRAWARAIWRAAPGAARGQRPRWFEDWEASLREAVATSESRRRRGAAAATRHTTTGDQEEG
eukprot:5040831-Pyramimonas_sp.AAC.1